MNISLNFNNKNSTPTFTKNQTNFTKAHHFSQKDLPVNNKVITVDTNSFLGALKAEKLSKFDFISFKGKIIDDNGQEIVKKAVDPLMKQTAMTKIDSALNPDVVIIQGASSKFDQQGNPNLGTITLSNIINNGYKGLTYALNPKGIVMLNKNGKQLLNDNGMPLMIMPGEAKAYNPDTGKFYNPKKGEKTNIKVFSTYDEINNDIQKMKKELNKDKLNILGAFVTKASESNVKESMANFKNLDVDGVAIIAAGFSENGRADGMKAHNALVESFNKSGLAVFGPNIVGIVNTDLDLNLTFMSPTSKFQKGKSIALVSASGAMLIALGNEGFPVKEAISAGNGAILTLTDLINNYKDRPEIEVITSYIENLGDSPTLGKELKEICKKKAVIIHKSGRIEAAQAAAAAHTGAAASGYGADEKFLKECGVIVSDKSDDLKLFTSTFSSLANAKDGGKILPKGRNIAILTNGGGAGSLMTDATESDIVVNKDGHIKMATLDSETCSILKGEKPLDIESFNCLTSDYNIDNKIHLPEDSAAFSNPNPSTLDTIADVSVEEYLKSAGALLNDKNVNSLLTYLVPLNKNFGKELDILKGLVKLQQTHQKPVLAVIQTDDLTAKDLQKILKEQDIQIPLFRNPEDANRASSALCKRFEWLSEQQSIEKKVNNRTNFTIATDAKEKSN